jgi:hypothetical protein
MVSGGISWCTPGAQTQRTTSYCFMSSSGPDLAGRQWYTAVWSQIGPDAIVHLVGLCRPT